MTPVPSGFFNILEEMPCSQLGRVTVFTFSLLDSFNSSGNNFNCTITTNRMGFSQLSFLLTLLRFVLISLIVVNLSSTSENRGSNFCAFFQFGGNKMVTSHAWPNGKIKNNYLDSKLSFRIHPSI